MTHPRRRKAPNSLTIWIDDGSPLYGVFGVLATKGRYAPDVARVRSMVGHLVGGGRERSTASSVGLVIPASPNPPGTGRGADWSRGLSANE